MLKLKNLTVHGLEPVNLDVAAGECLGIEGASGSGKTVLLRAIADLDLSEGDVFVNDIERQDVDGPEWRTWVRFAAAEPGWWGETPREHFADPDALTDTIAVLDLDPVLLDRPISRLSTGERQRLALARALEGDPEILLLDEPTGALDAKATTKAEKLLKSRLKAGTTILLVSHDPAQLKRMCGRKVTIRDGKVRAGRS